MSTEIKHIESVVKVYFTRQYGAFKFLKGNRDINEAKVKKIVQMCNRGVNQLKYAPIIVNKNMEIIDGQHRYAAARHLQENVYYVIQDDADLSIVPTINSNSSRWATRDFLNSYVDLKRSAYVELRAFLDEFPRVSISTAAKLFHSGESVSGEAMDAFRDGDLLSKYKDRAYDFANLLKDFAPYTENPFSSRFFTAIAMLDGNGKYDHEVMVGKLAKAKRRIDNITSAKTIIQDMELIYNHGNHSRVVIH